MQTVNFISWDEESSGCAGYSLHVGAVHWFLEKMVVQPLKEQSNLLLLQDDCLEFAANLCGWLPSPPNIMHLYTGSRSLPELKATAELAFGAAPPLRMDRSMIQRLSEAAQECVPFWQLLDQPRQERQMQVMDRRLRSAAAVILKQKERIQRLVDREEERRQQAGARSTPKKKKVKTAATPAAEPADLGTEEIKEEEPAEEPEPEHAEDFPGMQREIRKRRQLQLKAHLEELGGLSMDEVGTVLDDLTQEPVDLTQATPSQPVPPEAEQAASSAPRPKQGRSKQAAVPARPAQRSRSSQAR